MGSEQNFWNIGRGTTSPYTQVAVIVIKFASFKCKMKNSVESYSLDYILLWIRITLNSSKNHSQRLNLKLNYLFTVI